MNAKDITEAVAGLGLAALHLDAGEQGGLTPPTHARLEFLQEAARHPQALASLLNEQDAAPHKHATTQLELPPGVAYRLLRMGRAVPEAVLAGQGREHEPHVTLLYGLADADVGRVHAVLADEPPVTLKFGPTAFFPAKADAAPGEAHDVVFLSVLSPDLLRLHALVSRAVPHKKTHPTYRPHVTLAYVRPGEGRRFAGDRTLLGRAVTVKEVVFRRTDGEAWRILLGGKTGTPEPEAQSAPVPSAPPDAETTHEERVELARAGGPLFPEEPPRAKRVVREIERDVGGLMKRITEWEE
jgi:2'-5' RNA ligase